MAGMPTSAPRDERRVREVLQEERERQEHDRRADRREDRYLGDPVERVRSVDEQRVDDRGAEDAGDETDDRKHARVADGVADREEQTEAEREKDGGDHPLVDAVIGREEEGRRKGD